MDFALSEEQQMLRDSAERYFAEDYNFEKRRALLSAAHGSSEKHWRAFAEFGWLGLALPEDVGGVGCSFVETMLIAELLGRRLVLEPYTTTAVLCARLLERSDSELRSELLSALAAGQLRLALAHGEVDSYYSLNTVSTQARRSANRFILDGAKLMVLDAPAAHKLIVSAVPECEAQFALFVVDRDAKGLTITDYPLIDGTRAADITLESVSVPGTAMLAAPGKAFDVLDEAIDRLTVARVAEALGAMEVVLELTNEHLKNRVQFGSPLGKFQALQHRMAEMFVEVQETRSILYRAIAYLDRPAIERGPAVSAAKIVASNAGRFVGGQGIQLHGGVGVTDEYQVGHYYKRLLTLEKAFGDTDHHLERLAKSYR